MNALRYDSALSRTRHPWLPDVLPRSHPPDAYLQNPARARQERPIGQDRRPRTHAPRACLTIALTCILTGLTLSACPLPCAPPPARQSLPGSKRHQPARQGINLTSTSPPRSSLHHRRPNIEALIKDAERAAASSNSSSEQQQQQRAAATTANNSSEQQERAAAASSSSEQQQRAAAAVSSTSEQQQQRASNSSREQQQQQRAAAAIAAAVVNPTYPPVHPYVLSNVYPACISRMYLPYLECISVNISYLSRMISQYRA